MNFDEREYFKYLVEQPARSFLLAARMGFLLPGRIDLESLGIPEDAIRTPLHCEIPDSRATIREWVSFANQRELELQTVSISSASGAKDYLLAQKQSTLSRASRAFVIPASSNEFDYQEIVRGVQTRCLRPWPRSMELEGYLVVVFEKGVNFPSGRPLLDLLRIPVKRNDSWTYGPFFALWAAQRSPYKTSADGYPVVFSNAAAIAEIYDKTPQQGLGSDGLPVVAPQAHNAHRASQSLQEQGWPRWRPVAGSIPRPLERAAYAVVSNGSKHCTSFCPASRITLGPRMVWPTHLATCDTCSLGHHDQTAPHAETQDTLLK